MTEFHDEPVPNLPLLRKVLDFIDEHPERHNQARWGWENLLPGEECGTAMCVAGWAIYLSGQSLRDERGDGYSVNKAAELLGLTDGEALALFIGTIGDEPTRTRENIQRVAEQIATRAGEVL